jgi:hypothetical protein
MGSHWDDIPVGIEYHGLPGTSAECKKAVIRLLQCGERIQEARILTCGNSHCFLLTVNTGEAIAIKSGFSSGYAGEGPSAFSKVLQLLDAHGTEISEQEILPEVMARVDYSSLTNSDFATLRATLPLRGSRWREYMLEQHWDPRDSAALWHEFPLILPIAIIDPRIIDLALDFWQGPDDKLLTAYRRLEDVVRSRTELDEHSTKLFAQAFVGDSAKLGWWTLNRGEQTGRGNLFNAAYLAYRNRRAHRELRETPSGQVAEFLLLNHLYLIEKEATPRPDSAPTTS